MSTGDDTVVGNAQETLIGNPLALPARSLCPTDGSSNEQSTI
jgi:hypothetical protein